MEALRQNESRNRRPFSRLHLPTSGIATGGCKWSHTKQTFSNQFMTATCLGSALWAQASSFDRDLEDP
ncbi:hypothetical protein PT974_08940 [Cladobotryum mycophilum]|uniref:Uncharacterized protein n=1 Tax=Cladobotryum mycophilum TaxID=491253 RepID=A0ABR0SEW6_9HYPO